MAVVCSCRVFFVLKFLVLIISVCGTEQVPVLIWDIVGDGSHKVPNLSPFSQLSPDEFTDHLQRMIAARESKSKPVITVFLEDNLSVEDFGWEDVEEHSTFPQLENLTAQAAKVDFLPSVHAPLKGLKALGYPWHVYQSTDDLDSHRVNERGMVLLVRLGDAEEEENRPDFLRRHDRTISTIYQDLLSKYGNLIAVYTARHSSRIEPNEEPSVRRVRSLLAVDDTQEGNNATFWRDKDNKIFLYSPVPPRVNTMTSDPSQAFNITGNDITRDDRMGYQRLVVMFTVNSTRKGTVRLRFPVSGQNYWNLEEVEYEEDGNMTLLRTSSDIYAPVGFSYHCGSEIVFKNGSITFNLTNVQIQPNVQDMKFGDAYDCVWFFSIAIWSGLFVTAILALIMIWGLTMILDIKTMDRFDDPKGKTITISASE
ncbi:V-type proton ATPase subunit S1 [Anabrus simplex]|uniref:V-type proton ATPase subunit S1 n=1 Tax=Anabrus simplex TaxID=316456 RepID=UPI0035A2A394